MKRLKPSGILGTAVIALLLFTASCKKSSSSSSSTSGTGTNSFALNGQSASVSRINVDTSVNGITVIGVAIFPATKDTAAITLEFSNEHEIACSQYMGTFSDTSTVGLTAQLTYTDELTGNMYQDMGIGGNTHFQGTITSNNGTTISGTFSGTLSPIAGSGTSDITVTGGTFTVTL